MPPGGATIFRGSGLRVDVHRGVLLLDGPPMRSFESSEFPERPRVATASGGLVVGKESVGIARNSRGNPELCLARNPQAQALQVAVRENDNRTCYLTRFGCSIATRKNNLPESTPRPRNRRSELRPKKRLPAGRRARVFWWEGMLTDRHGLNSQMTSGIAHRDEAGPALLI